MSARASLRSAHAPGASPAKPIRIDDDDPWMKMDDDHEGATTPRKKTGGSGSKGVGSGGSGRGALLSSASKARASTTEATKAASSTPVKAASAAAASSSPARPLLTPSKAAAASASATRGGTSSISDRALVAAVERANAKRIQDEIDRGAILNSGRGRSRSFIPASAVKALAATATLPAAAAAGSKRRRAESPAVQQSDDEEEESASVTKRPARRSLIHVLKSPLKLPRPASAEPKPRGKPGSGKKQRTASPAPASSSSSSSEEEGSGSEDDAASEEEEDAEEKQPAKRRGGKPRKSAESASAAFQSASAKKPSSGRSRSVAGSSMEDVPESSSASPAKKPRGRAAAGASSSTPKRRTILDAEEVQEEKDDVCTICHDGGFLMVCDQCVHAFHTGCLSDHHESNYEFLKEHQDADSLCCRDVHLSCTTRKEVMHVARVELDVEPEDPADKRMAVKWVGPLKRAGGRKFFRAFTRGPHRFEIGSYVTLLNGEPAAAGQRNFLVGEIESLFEDLSTHLQMVEIRWLYLPEETRTGRLAHHHPQEVFSTAHTDVNEIECISDLCEVVDETEFHRRAEEDRQAGITEAVRARAQQVFMLRQRYDHDGPGRFLPLIHGPGGVQRAGAAARERAVNPRLALATQARPKSSKAHQSIYSQACAQLQLSAAPPKLPCRDQEKKVIEKFLVDGIQRGTSNGGLYIAGVPGTGKTATVDRIMRELAARDDLPDFEYVEINGMKLKDPSDLYSSLWKSLTGRSASNAKACQNLDARFQTRNRKRPICVLLVDELDFIMTRQQNVIYNLFDWPGRLNSRLIVLGISNTIDLPHLLMPKVHSRLGLQKLHFQPYTHEQIVEIITDRLREIPAFGTGAIEICARKIASVSGDVRRALQVCRRAAEICEEEQMAREATKAGGKKKAAAAASASSAAAAAPAAAAAADSSSSVFEVTERHVMAAISDLQNSSFITWLRGRCSALDQVLLAAMLARIKFAAAAPSATGGRVLAAGGDEYPLVPLRDLTDQARTIWDTKGMSAYMARAAGLTAATSSAASAAAPYPAPTHGDWGRLVHQWAALRLVNLSYLVGDVDPLVQLNIIPDDIEEACGKMEVWLKIRSSQS